MTAITSIHPTQENRLIGAVLLEINDDWVIQSRYMQIEGMAELAAMPDKNDVIAISTMAA